MTATAVTGLTVALFGTTTNSEGVVLCDTGALIGIGSTNADGVVDFAVEGDQTYCLVLSFAGDEISEEIIEIPVGDSELVNDVTGLIDADRTITANGQFGVDCDETGTDAGSSTQIDDNAADEDGVDPDGLDTAECDFVDGPGTPPLGTGSLEFDIDDTNDDNGFVYAVVDFPGFDGLALADLSALSYCTYIQSTGPLAGPENVIPVMQIAVDHNGDGVRMTR